MPADFKPSALPSCILMAAAIALSAGCGGDPFQRQPIKGVASFAGKPIKFGTVRFEPAEKQPAGTSASIKDGEFKVERAAGIGLENTKYGFKPSIAQARSQQVPHPVRKDHPPKTYSRPNILTSLRLSSPSTR